MTDPTPLALAKKFAEKAALLPGIKAALHYEPEELPSLPCVTMLQRRVDQTDRFTGPATENVWTWAVYLTVPLGGRVAGSDWQQGQELLYTLIPEVLSIARNSPDLDGLATRAVVLSDLGEEPDFDVESRSLTKILELSAVTEEV